MNAEFDAVATISRNSLKKNVSKVHSRQGKKVEWNKLQGIAIVFVHHGATQGKEAYQWSGCQVGVITRHLFATRAIKAHCTHGTTGYVIAMQRLSIVIWSIGVQGTLSPGDRFRAVGFTFSFLWSYLGLCSTCRTQPVEWGWVPIIRGIFLVCCFPNSLTQSDTSRTSM